MPDVLPRSPCAMMPGASINSDKGNSSIHFSKTWKGAQWTQLTSQWHCTVSCCHHSMYYKSHHIYPKVNSTQVSSQNQKTETIVHMRKKTKQDLTRFWEAGRFMHLNIALLFTCCILKEKLSGSKSHVTLQDKRKQRGLFILKPKQQN